MRATSKAACWRSARAASVGTSPVSANASLAASSTDSHCSKRFSSPKMRPISGRVYRGIIFQLASIDKALGGLIGGSLGLGNHQPREETAAIQGLRRHQAHDLRMIVVRAQMAQYQRRGAGAQLIADEVAG